MATLTSLKNGGKQFPLDAIVLLIVDGFGLIIYLDSGAKDSEWCSLKKAETLFQEHNIKMFRASQSVLIQFSVIEDITANGKLRLKKEFLERLQPHDRPICENIIVSRRQKPVYKKYCRNRYTGNSNSEPHTES